MGWYWNPLGMIGVVNGVIALALALVLFTTAPERPATRRLALVLFLEAPGGLLGGGLLYLTDNPPVGFAAQAVTYAFAAPLSLAYLYFLGTLPVRWARPLASRAAAAIYVLVGLAYLALVVVRTDWFIAGLAATDYARLESVHGPWIVPLAVYPALLIAALGLVVALWLWLASPHGSMRRRQGRMFALAFGVRDLTYLWLLAGSFVLELGSAMAFWAIGIGFLVFYVLLAYAVLKHQLFGLDLKLKWTIRRGTIVGALAAMFLIVTKLTESWAERMFGENWVVGAVATGLMLFAITPLQRFADRIANRALPDVQDTPAYRQFRAMELYKAALEELSVGGVTDKERRALRALQTRLAIAPAVALAMERDLKSASAT